MSPLTVHFILWRMEVAAKGEYLQWGAKIQELKIAIELNEAEFSEKHFFCRSQIRSSSYWNKCN